MQFYNVSNRQDKQYVSKIEVDGTNITLTDVMGEQKVIAGSITMVDLAGGIVEIKGL